MKLALRQFRRGLAAGDYRTLIAALVVTIAALTAVGLFAGRMAKLLNTEANNLLAADAVLTADHPIPAHFADAARAAGLVVAQTQAFPSMAAKGDAAVLASVKVIDGAYPLRGKLWLAGHAESAVGAPPAGSIWLDPRLANRLKLKVGDTLRLGNTRFNVAALIDREPDAALDFASLQPRLMMNAADLAQTGLVGFGSRIKYRLLVAGPPQAVAAWQQQARSTLARGERLEDVREARPEVKTALERAETFLRLVTLLAATLSGTAVLLAARRFAARRADAVALYVTLGATRAQIRGILLGELLLLFVFGALAGGALGWAAQEVLGWAVRDRLPAPLPAGSFWPWIAACGFGGVLLIGVAGPALLRLAATPPIRVLRRETTAPPRLWLTLALTGIATAALFVGVAGNAKLAAIVAAGIAGALLVAGLLGWVLLLLFGRFAKGFAARIAVRQLARRRWLAAAQLGALAVGLLGLWLLTVVERDLLSAWEKRVPVDAPNQFAINIQPDQAASLDKAFADAGFAPPALQPMIRGRWMAQNGKQVEPKRFEDDRAQRLAEREFNLSWGETLRADNRLDTGTPLDESKPGYSVEAGLAKTLGIKLGDTLTFDVAGTRVSAPVVNLRTVDWDSFRVNFFVVGTRSLFAELPASLITSFHLPAERRDVVARWSAQFPNVTFIDVGEVLGEVRRVLELASSALRLVFGFCLAAGLTVLLAALETTAPERRREAAVMRALGASRAQITKVQWIEGAAIGATAGLVAGVAASVSGWLLAREVLELTVPWNWQLPLMSLATGVLLAALITAWERRQLSRASALRLLRDPG
ncbi:ABC transporter permease [Jeongeupia naejangsanensis]|uniref:FtsX-like permease family protein n=1 Tax=Jeongeupia naejangsanensis TaxID=613195 RepID=A0ABS2BKF1_9NEIS|nr:FtsX-like permease family protein [Jeongeupia naejangsanensis]MBM3116092.1 FtsX-like permease family protein [Jeongeupia naejangsanensis]